MKNKNNTFFCGDNQEADQLFCMIESNSVLSESFNEKIKEILFITLTNLDDNKELIMDKIKNLKDEMKWVNIFSESFINMLNSQLLLTVSSQEKLNKEVHSV